MITPNPNSKIKPRTHTESMSSDADADGVVVYANKIQKIEREGFVIRPSGLGASPARPGSPPVDGGFRGGLRLCEE
jgi:hypothetical protein